VDGRGHTRRELLRGAAVLGGALLAGGCKRKEPGEGRAPPEVLTNVPEYLDRMLQSPAVAKMKDSFLGGLEALDRRSRRRFDLGFAEATSAQQDELLTEFKDAKPGSGESRFYEMLIAFTMEGFLGDPTYGGNKDRVGWALVGFSTMEPPQGYDGTQHLLDPSKSTWKGSGGACH
jgi:gluconate 2-dehydrogenase gamma chain